MGGRKLIYAPRASADLQDIIRYIASDSPARALAFGNRLALHARQAAEFPSSGRVVPELGKPDVRELILSSYRIIYRQRSDSLVEILRFWHAARGKPLL